MAESNYTLRDKSYFNLLGELSSELERAGVEYALVGGAGIQARVSEKLSKVRGTDISSLEELDLLRKTKDIDITSRADDIKFASFFNNWQLINPNISLEEMYGKKKNIQFKTAPYSVDIMLNYQTDPSDLKGLGEKFYYECIDTAEPLELWHGNKDIGVRVAKPEYLIASKLTRSAEKDIYDISLMLKIFDKDSSNRIDFNKIRNILNESDKPYKIGVLEDIIKDVLKK